MPGIIALADLHAPGGPDALATRMLARLRHYDWYAADRLADAAAGVALGRAALRPADEPVRSHDSTLWAVMDGELYDAAERRAELAAAGCRFGSASAAEILLHGYRQGGREFFGRLEGKFVAALWDAAAGQLIAVADPLGMRPLYWARVPGGVLVASEIKALLADGRVGRRPDPAGLAEFLTFGQYLNERSSLAGTEVLPPASCLVYEPAADRLAVEQYAPPLSPADPPQSQAEWLDRIDTALVRAVARRTAGTPGLGLSLSGGLDARTILAVIDHRQVPLTTVALGVRGCRDHRSASALAALTNGRHHNYVLGDGFLDQFETHLRRMVHLTDGQYLSQCIVMPTLPFYREVGIEVLLRGHAGELMHMNKAYNFSLDRAALALPDDAAVADWAYRHLRAYMLEAVDGPLLAGEAGEAEELARAGLAAALDRLPAAAPPAQRIWRLFLDQRTRRETALSLVKFGSLVETRLPYLDPELVALLLAAPPELKLGETIQAEILRRHRPAFLDVINVNTGTRIGAGLWARRVASLRQRVLAKLRLPGYQPYERIGLWLRRELRGTVERLLLGDRALGRGHFRADALRRTVGQHLAGRRNHTYLVLALMIVELAQRMLADGEDVREEP